MGFRNSRRQVEAVRIVTALALLLLAAPVLVRAGSAGWRNGVLFAVADGASSLLPGNLDVPVAIAAGIIAGWLLLFALDATKRIQTLTLLPVVAWVVFQLERFDHILGAASNELPYSLLSVVLTLTVTLVLIARTGRLYLGDHLGPRTVLDELRLLHFPAASRALFTALAVVVAVVVFQYPFVPHESGDPSFVLVALSGIIALPSLAVFVQYTSMTDVVMLTPEQGGSRAEMSVLGGLFSAAKPYHRRASDRDSDDILREKGIKGEAPSRRKPVQFRYLPPQLWQRIVEVTSVGHSFSTLVGNNGFTGEGTRQGVQRQFRRGVERIGQTVQLMLPTAPESRVLKASDAVKAVEAADTVLLIVPFPESDDTDAYVQAERAASLLRQLENETHANLGRLEVKLIITHADRAEGIDTESGGSATGFDNSETFEIVSQLSEGLPDSESPDGEELPKLDSESTQDTNLDEVKIAYSDSLYPVAGTPPFQRTRGYDSILVDIAR